MTAYEKPRLIEPTMTKLLPCPFCSGRPTIKHLYVAGEPSHSKIECTNCHIKTDYYVYQFGERNVIDVWNRRADARATSRGT